KELMDWIEKVKTPHLRSLLDSFFQDDKYLTAFLRAPSARTMHQAYVGGLVEHTLGVTKNAVTIADNYSGVDKDLLITGALLHDGFKVVEYSQKTTIEFTDKGRLLGHLCMMAMEIENRTRAIPDFPEETKTLLEHMILSHHGKREYGSPKVPMTAEALILFYADYIDAYLSAYFEQKQKAHKRGDKWTEWVDMFEGFLYAGENSEKKSDDEKTKGEA
ncbi:HD domain-containing protein, partial [Candidatus Sumerlaeota bacterium]|nr:HD domain-containing protein [Candidatus Sumerlaeota bacterium]